MQAGGVELPRLQNILYERFGRPVKQAPLG
jgi:hypothetical protein